MTMQMAEIKNIDPAIIEKIVVNGDISSLKTDERLSYYYGLCHRLGLNPDTRPFEYMALKGKLTLYAKKDATEQLRKLHKVSVNKLDCDVLPNGLYRVTAYVATPDGRSDISTGVVNSSNLKGDDLANAYMKAETKAKRRATLSICGLGIVDESEVESIRGAIKIKDVTGLLVEEETDKPLKLVENKEPAVLMEIEMTEAINSINMAISMDELKDAWSCIIKSTLTKDKSAIDRLTMAKDEKKQDLLNNVTDVEFEQG